MANFTKLEEMVGKETYVTFNVKDNMIPYLTKWGHSSKYLDITNTNITEMEQK